MYILQVASLASLAQLLPPRSPTRRQTALCAELLLHDRVRFSCCSLIASTAAPHSMASPSAAAPQLCPLQLLLAACVHFSCCSPIASALAAAPRWRPLQLLLPIAYASTAATSASTAALIASASCSQTFFARSSKYEGRASLV